MNFMLEDFTPKKTKIIHIFEISFILLWICSLSVFAQTGSIEGMVIDKKTNEALVGANVVIEGINTYAVADYDGRYKIGNLKPGQYSLKVTYVSYRSVIIDSVIVMANKITLLNALLEETAININNVTITAVRRTGTDISMISAVKANPIVVSGISAQQISRSQDRDASEVVRRVPGITILDDRFIVVRGLNQRYNNVWLNNTSTPSSETDVKAFSFDVIPSGMIDNLLVYKSTAPEIPAEFAGGFINISTKNMPDSSFTVIDYAAGYRHGTTFSNYSHSAGGKYDWLGIDDGSRTLPKNFPSDLGKVTSPAAVNSLADELKNNYAISQKNALPDQKVSLTLANRILIKKVVLGNMTVINYGNSYSDKFNENSGYATYDIIRDSLRYNFRYHDNSYTNQVKWGVLHNWAIFLGKGHKIEFRNLFNQTGLTSTTLRQGTFYENFRTERSYQERFMSRTTYSGQLGGDHYMNGGNTKVNWNFGYAMANKSEPDKKVLVSGLDESTNTYKLIIQSSPNPNFAGRFYQDNHEKILSAGLNFDQKLEIFSITPSIKAGYFLESKHRKFNARNIGYITGGQFDPTDPGTVGILYLPIDQVFVESNLDYNTKLTIAENTNKSDSYTADNKLFSGYAALNIPFSKQLNLYGGVRIEKNQMTLSSYRQDQSDVPVNINNDKTNFFPSANLSFNFTEKSLVRLAYGRSINRAEFREIAPYFFFDFDKNASFRGTPELKDADIQNFDLRFEHYPSQGETFSLALFYKHFANPIEMVNSNEGSGKSYKFQNANEAKNYGIELDVRKALATQGMLQYFNLVANGSLIYSRVIFTGEEKKNSLNRPLQGQSPYIANVGLFFNKPEAGFMFSALYNIIGKRIIAVGKVAQNSDENIPDEYEMPRNVIDLVVAKKIGKHIEIKCSIKDLLNNPVEFRQTFEFNKNGEQVKRVGKTTYYYPGSLYLISLSVRL
jgi:outer membrane receptor for ferrienterochelin and colicin